MSEVDPDRDTPPDNVHGLPRRERGKRRARAEAPENPPATERPSKAKKGKAKKEAPKKAFKRGTGSARRMEDFFAVLPLYAGQFAVKVMTDLQIDFEEEDIKETRTAFRDYLDSIDFELTPGWALLATYAGVTSGAAFVAMEGKAREMMAEEQRQAAANKAKAEGAPPAEPPGSVVEGQVVDRG